MDLHISLVGAQPLPVFNGVRYVKPDSAFLLHSKDTLDVAQNVNSALEGRCQLFEVELPLDYNYCLQKFEYLVKNVKDVDISVNVSGGTKIMTLAALEVARKNSLRCFYMDQNNQVVDLPSGKSMIYSQEIELGRYFQLFGQSAQGTSRFDMLEENMLEFGRMISVNYSKMNGLLGDFRKNKYDEKRSFKLKNSKCELGWDVDKQSVMVYVDSTGEETHVAGENAFHIVFNTGWWELEVGEMLNGWPLARRIYWNTKIPRHSVDNIKNEIDLIVDTGVKMLFFEVKTQVFDIKDIDKFRNVVRNYGGLGAKSYLITLFKPSPEVIEKCNDNKMPVFWFIEGTGSKRKSKTQFLYFVEEEMKLVNTI